MQELSALFSFGAMNAAAPGGAFLRGGWATKTPLPALPRRGPEAGVFRIK